MSSSTRSAKRHKQKKTPAGAVAAQQQVQSTHSMPKRGFDLSEEGNYSAQAILEQSTDKNGKNSFLVGWEVPYNSAEHDTVEPEANVTIV